MLSSFCSPLNSTPDIPGIISVVTAGIISVVIGDHFGGGDHFDDGDHFGGGTAPGISIFSALNGKFQGVGTLEFQTPRGGDAKRGQMPRPPSTLQHFSLTTQSSSDI